MAKQPLDDLVQRSYERGYNAHKAGPPYMNPYFSHGRTPEGPSLRALRVAWESGLRDADRAERGDLATTGEVARAAGIEAAA